MPRLQCPRRPTRTIGRHALPGVRLCVPDRVVGLALAGLRGPVRPTCHQGDGEGSGRGAPAAARKKRTSGAFTTGRALGGGRLTRPSVVLRGQPPGRDSAAVARGGGGRTAAPLDDRAAAGERGAGARELGLVVCGVPELQTSVSAEYSSADDALSAVQGGVPVRARGAVLARRLDAADNPHSFFTARARPSIRLQRPRVIDPWGEASRRVAHHSPAAHLPRTCSCTCRAPTPGGARVHDRPSTPEGAHATT